MIVISQLKHLGLRLGWLILGLILGLVLGLVLRLILGLVLRLILELWVYHCLGWYPPVRLMGWHSCLWGRDPVRGGPEGFD